MKKAPLSQTNPHIKDRAKARKGLIRNLASSTAIETGEDIKAIEHKLAVKHFSRFPVKLAWTMLSLAYSR